MVEYIPPKSEAIRAFARRFCEAFAAQTHDPAFLQPHVIRGLAEFLELATWVQAKRLNREQVDSDEK
jgi:hypothetical protein